MDESFEKVVQNISRNNHIIIDDWCKAYLAQLYEEGVELKPGAFILNQQETSEKGKIGYKYWFTLKD